MGFRYRKSINIGGGFRVNISKTGIGYSWGGKGYRVTKTAKGTTRYTTSIPGTGISYVQETGKKKVSHPVNQNTLKEQNNYYGTAAISNSISSDTVSDELKSFIRFAKILMISDKVLMTLLIVSALIGIRYYLFFILTAVLLIFEIIVRVFGRINIEYNIEEEQKNSISERINPFVKITNCSKVWRIVQTSGVINTKYSGGANQAVKRLKCKVSNKAPFPFKVNEQCAVFKSNKETLCFLPDKLFIIKGSNIGALNYDEIAYSSTTTQFQEPKTIPNDAQVVGRTWKYINKSGGPDKRFSNNPQIPLCLYGEIYLYSPKGVNLVIMYSNPNVFFC